MAANQNKAIGELSTEVEFIDRTHGFVEISHRVTSAKAGVFAALKDTGLYPTEMKTANSYLVFLKGEGYIQSGSS